VFGNSNDKAGSRSDCVPLARLVERTCVVQGLLSRVDRGLRLPFAQLAETYGKDAYVRQMTNIRYL